MASPRRWAALAALVLVVAAGAFAAGRMTRPEPAAQPPAATLSKSSVDVSIPALAVSGPVPALKETPAEGPAAAGGEVATSGGSPSTGTTGSSGGTPSGGGGGGSTSDSPVIVGGGTD